jgi:hypothetical protein
MESYYQAQPKSMLISIKITLHYENYHKTMAKKFRDVLMRKQFLQLRHNPEAYGGL